MNIDDYVSSNILKEIANQIEIAVSKAEAGYEDNEADEDSLTGALGQSIRDNVQGVSNDRGATVSWRAKSRKYRGRGVDAPEKTHGSDALLIFEVMDVESGRVIFSKLLAIQAKKQLSSFDKNLAEQAKKMSSFFGSGIVADFSDKNYGAFDIQDVNSVHPRLHKPTGRKSLSEVLSSDFLKCKVGSKDLFFNPTTGLVSGSPTRQLFWWFPRTLVNIEVSTTR